MDKIKSKDLIIIILGIILTAIIGLIIKIYGYNIEELNIKNISQNLLFIIPVVIAIVVIIYMKLNETNKEFDRQEINIQKLEEKFKIYEQLIDMRAEIKEMQKKVFKK